MRNATTFTLILLSVLTAYSQDFWERTNSPGSATERLAINASGHLFAGVSGMGMFRSENDGDSWTEVNQDLTIPNITGIAIDMNTGHIFVSGFDLTGTENGVFRSTNNGESWTAVAALTNARVWSLAINGSGHIFAGTAGAINDRVFRSTDGGETWTPIGAPRSVLNLAINASGHIFACSGPYLYRSTDNGDSWSYVGPDSLSGGYYGSVAFSPLGATFLTEYEPGEVGLYSRIWRSTNKGDSWTMVRPWSLGIFQPLAVNSKGHVFAGGWGVIRSTDDGMTWEDVSSGCPGAISLVVNSKDRIFASSNAVYRTRRTTTSVEDGRRETPADFSLEQNYPNPFNPSTKIGFKVQGSGFVTLKVYDLLGRKIRTLVNDNLPPGSYEVTFDATGLASGVYLYRLRAGEFTQTKRMVLMR